jgi:hypothetical protein
VLRVPLIFHGPGVPPGPRIARDVSLRDVGATVLDLLGAGEGALPGTSRAAAWAGREGEEFEPSPVLAEVHAGPLEPPIGKMAGEGIRGYLSGGILYLRNGDGSEEVFGLRGDPMGERNRIGEPRGKEMAAKMRQELEEKRREPSSR